MKFHIPDLGRKELRNFGYLTSGIIVFLFGLLVPWVFERGYPLWPWVVAAVLSGVALVMPTFLRPVYRGWMRVGHGLGWINTRLILAILFFMIFLPVGVVMRLLGRDPMMRTFTRQRSYRVPTDEHPRQRFERPF